MEQLYSRRPRYMEATGQMPDDHVFAYPKRGGIGHVVEAVANATTLKRARRAALRWLPYPVLESDIVDVVYLNWLVEVARLRHLIPPGVEVWEHNGRTVLSILT